VTEVPEGVATPASSASSQGCASRRYIEPSCRALRLDDVLLVRWTHCSGEALDRRMCAKVDLGPTGVPITAIAARPECAVRPASQPTIHRAGEFDALVNAYMTE